MGKPKMAPVFFFLSIFVVTSAFDPYIPCQSYISFSYDDSYIISDTDFKTQMNFIKNAIGALNYPNRLRAEGGYGGEFNWKSGLSIPQMQSAIDNAEQTSLPYSLLQQFSSLATSVETLNDYNSDALYNPTSTKPVTAQSTTMSNFPTPTPELRPYVPCQVLITVLSDISNALSTDQFRSQITFIKNVMNQINHLERVRYGAYYEGNGNLTYKWNDTNTQDGLQQAIDNTKQISIPTSLAGAMRVLMNNAPQNRTIPESAIIFVTDTTDSIQIQQAVNLYNSVLKPRGVRLTFILAGNKTDANALRGFDDVIIFNWQNMNISQPDGWDLSAALTCTPQTFPPPTMGSYIPCQSWISFGIDDSNVLQNNDFMTQLNFISSVIGNITHPERIAAVGMYSQPIPWNSGLSLQLIQQAVVGMFQGGAYSLKQQFAAILTNLQNTQTGNTPVGALIFISDTSDQALADVANTFGQLHNVRITFVLVGQNPDQNKLTQFSNNFISWRDLSKPQPDNWDAQAAAAYGCM
uniref:VWFA domain-containing protein n=1 Tax=Panagrolaimus davidi TaxID=227884 RepID=A0A914QA46_9BILA